MEPGTTLVSILSWLRHLTRFQRTEWKSFERNRNLFYVACSRPTTRLAVLFTQLLSNGAMQTLRHWFGADAVQEFTP